MNIKEAKEEIKAALQAYHEKDETGMYVYPVVRQRPILLMGPPGIGKTAVMEQIAMECKVGLVSYTMTHHTRQSAIGLPKIITREYEGRHYSATEYTLCEIIASVYECMQRTGKREGILFIDEINCVSETLAPVMLQFLQNKTFGSHRVPAGWMIVAAGNPSAFNKSVREFDIVTLDRVRRIDVEADVSCWMEYAAGAGIHGAIQAYLTLKPERFYQIRQERGEKSFVTARGWEDLSQLMKSYEALGHDVTAQVVEEFLQDRSEAASFNTYYQIYRKYGNDYRIREMLQGNLKSEESQSTVHILERAFLEERLTAVMQMGDVISTSAQRYGGQERVQEQVRELSEKFRGSDPGLSLEAFIRHQEDILESKLQNDLLTFDEERTCRLALSTLRQVDEKARTEHIYDEQGIGKLLERAISGMEASQEQAAHEILAMTERAFALCEEALGEQELFLLVSALARCTEMAVFLTNHTSERFIHWSGKMFGERDVEG